VNPRDTADWDRAAELRAIQETYDQYDRTNRARLWDERDPGYSRMVGALQARLVVSLAASLPAGGGRVLDLGCGDGNLAAKRHALVPPTEWIGLDLRPEAIAAARVRFPELTFMVGSADDVPLEDASVDVIVARVLFSSLPSTRLEAAVAGEVGRLLRPNGWLVWLDIRYGNPNNPAVHGMPMSRIRRLFPGWTYRLQTAGLLPPLARRLGPLSALGYPVLAAIPPLRSHLVGRLAPPSHGG
jgi:SAM-dependent methyltransferase